MTLRLTREMKSDERYMLGWLPSEYFPHIYANSNTPTHGLGEFILFARRVGLEPLIQSGHYTLDRCIYVELFHEAKKYKPDGKSLDWHPNPLTQRGLSIVGSRRKNGKYNYPEFVLKDGAKDFDGEPRAMLCIRQYEAKKPGRLQRDFPHQTLESAPRDAKVDASWAFGIVLRGINFITGKNPSAVAYSAPSAQESYCQINVDARGGYAGVMGAPGRNCVTRAWVNGGQHGVIVGKKTGASGAGEILAGCHLVNQEKEAVVVDGFCPVTIAGSWITSKGAHPLITTRARNSSAAGSINIEDTHLANKGKTLVDNTAGVNLTMRNVTYAGKNVEKVVLSSGNHDLPANGRTISRYAFNRHGKSKGKEFFSAVMFWKGKKVVEGGSKAIYGKPIHPRDWTSLYSIEPTQVESFEDDCVIASAFDSPASAIRRAKEEGHNTVWHPAYKSIQDAIEGKRYTLEIDDPIVLGKDTIWAGAGSWAAIVKPSNKFPANHPIVDTLNDQGATCSLQNIGFAFDTSWYEKAVTLVRWMAGANSSTFLLRARAKYKHGPKESGDRIVGREYSQHAGGVHLPGVFDSNHIDWRGPINAAKNGKPNPRNCNLLVKDTDQPLLLLGCNSEGGKDDERDFNNYFVGASNFIALGFKGEGTAGVGSVLSCNNFSIGSGGAHRDSTAKGGTLWHLDACDDYCISLIPVQTVHAKAPETSLIRISDETGKLFDLKYPGTLVAADDGMFIHPFEPGLPKQLPDSAGEVTTDLVEPPILEGVDRFTHCFQKKTDGVWVKFADAVNWIKENL